MEDGMSSAAIVVDQASTDGYYTAMNEPGNLTTAQVLAATGIKDRGTLTRWYKAGLICPPALSDHPSGRGKVGLWPRDILPRIELIRKLQGEGLSLSGIRQKLGRLRRSVPPSELSQRSGDYHPLATVAAKLGYLLELKAESTAHASVGKQFFDKFSRRASVEEAVEIVRVGEAPIAAYSGGEILICSARQFGDRLASRARGRDSTWVVVALLPELAEVCREHGVSLKPQTPSRVSRKKGPGLKEMRTRLSAEDGESSHRK